MPVLWINRSALPAIRGVAGEIGRVPCRISLPAPRYGFTLALCASALALYAGHLVS